MFLVLQWSINIRTIDCIPECLRHAIKWLRLTNSPSHVTLSEWRQINTYKRIEANWFKSKWSVEHFPESNNCLVDLRINSTIRNIYVRLNKSECSNMTYSFHHVILYHNHRRPFTCQRKIWKFQRKNEMTEFINKTNS